MEFMDFLKSVPSSWYTTAPLLGLAIFMLFSGRLIPRSTYEDLKSSANERLAEKNEEIKTWREAHAKSEEVRREVASLLTSQTGDLKSLSGDLQTILRFVQIATRPGDTP